MSTPELKPETPITDAEQFYSYSEDHAGNETAELVVTANLARSLESALNAAREAIENAPHGCGCSTFDGFAGVGTYTCDCWKAEALAQISPQQSKTT